MNTNNNNFIFKPSSESGGVLGLKHMQTYVSWLLIDSLMEIVNGNYSSNILKTIMTRDNINSLELLLDSI